MEKKQVDQISVAELIQPVLETYRAKVELVGVTSDRFLKVRITGEFVSGYSAKKNILEMIEAAFKEVICSDIKGVILVGKMRRKIGNAVNLLRRDITKHCRYEMTAK